MVLVDKNQGSPQDRSQVMLDDPAEVRYWCTRLAVSEDELRACVVEVGTRAEDVEQRLKKVGLNHVLDNTGED